VTPSTFPTPPQGTNGILVFPFAAGEIGVPGGSALPSPDWDNAPVNFFNDFGCANGGKTSDCYPYELFPAPLFAGSTTAPRTVGFDVDLNAVTVQAYIVVAADLRDNPRLTLRLPSQANLVGFVVNGIDVFNNTDPTAGDNAVGNSPDRGFYSFEIQSIPAGATIVSATLRAYQTSVIGDPYTTLGNVIVDHLDYGAALNASAFDAAALASNIGTLSSTPTLEYKALDVTASVVADRAAARARSQFRLRFSPLELGPGFANRLAVFDVGTGAGANPPQLVVVYRAF